jgi:2-methylisocitrate lyase-like PEP mutase family enzyme
VSAGSLVTQFRALHNQRVSTARALLVLPNAWDALSARLFETAGAEAVATSSAVLAWAHGYRDGEQLPVDTLVSTVREIASRSSIPTSVDLERGYASQPERVAELVERLLHAGAVGINLEDAAGSPHALADKIKAVRARVGAKVFINARTCIVLHGKVSADQLVRELIERARLFEAAGADGLFVPLLHQPGAVEALARESKLPLNIMWIPGLPSYAELAALGVRRISAGPRLGQLAYQAAAQAARGWLEQADNAALAQGGALDYLQANALWSAS